MFIALLCFNFLFPFFFHSIWRPKRNFHPNGEMFPLSRLIRTTLTLQTTAQVCDELPLSGGRKRSHPWLSRSSDATFTQRFVVYTISHWIITAALQPCGCRGQMRKLRFRDENRKIEGNQFFKIITTKTKHSRHSWLPSQLVSRSTRVAASCSIFSRGGMPAKNTPGLSDHRLPSLSFASEFGENLNILHSAPPSSLLSDPAGRGHSGLSSALWQMGEAWRFFGGMLQVLFRQQY